MSQPETEALIETPAPITGDRRPFALGELVAVKAKIKALEAEASALSKGLMLGLFDDGLTEYTVPGVVKMLVQSRTTQTLNRVKLIGAGVDPATLEACTDVRTSEPFVTLYPVKPKDE